MKSNFISISTIVCPQCNMKQTGIVRLYNPDTQQPVDVNTDEPPSIKDIFAIRCCWSKCQHLIFGEELNIVTQATVKTPMDFKS